MDLQSTNLLVTLIIGGVIGWLASILMRADGQMGIVANVIVGIIGSFLGVYVAGALGVRTLTARWTYEDGQVVDESKQTITPSGSAAVTEFHLSKPDGWPAGGYKVEVLLNGTSAGTKDFKVT